MVILALDAAKKMGWAVGAPGGVPVSGSVELAPAGLKADVEDLAAGAGKFILNKIRAEGVTMIAIEHFMDPAGQRNSSAVVTSITLHAVAAVLAGFYQLKFVSPTVATWRKGFCGRSTAMTGGTAPQRSIANKRMAAATAALHGYLPAGSTDFDRCDALGVWHYAASVHGRQVFGKVA